MQPADEAIGLAVDDGQARAVPALNDGDDGLTWLGQACGSSETAEV